MPVFTDLDLQPRLKRIYFSERTWQLQNKRAALERSLKWEVESYSGSV